MSLRDVSVALTRSMSARPRIAMNAMVLTATPSRSLAASVRDVVGFDLRRLRAVAALMVALELARAAFVEWGAAPLTIAIGDGFGGTFGTEEIPLLDALLVVATVLATALVVQANLPSDDRAFWRTRPIAPLALALGKLTTLSLLLVVVPSTVNAARLLDYGAPLSAAAAGAVQSRCWPAPSWCQPGPWRWSPARCPASWAPRSGWSHSVS